MVAPAARELRQTVADLERAGATFLTLDLSAVTEIDDLGVQELALVVSVVGLAGGTVALRRPPPPIAAALRQARLGPHLE